MIPTARIHDACRPEPVEQHQQHEVQQRDKYHVEHEYEIAVGPHLAHEAESDGRTGQLHTGGAGRNAHFERRHDNDVEDNEEHAVHPAGEGLVGVLGRDFIGSTFLAQSLKWGFTVVVLLVFSLIRLFPYVPFQGHIVAAEPWKIHSSTIFLTVS